MVIANIVVMQNHKYTFKSDTMKWTTVKNVGRKITDNSGDHVSYIQVNVSNYTISVVVSLHSRGSKSL